MIGSKNRFLKTDQSIMIENQFLSETTGRVYIALQLHIYHMSIDYEPIFANLFDYNIITSVTWTDTCAAFFDAT